MATYSVYVIDEANLEYLDPVSGLWVEGVPTESSTTASVVPTSIQVTSGSHGSLIEITDTEDDGVLDENTNAVNVEAQTINGGDDHIWVDYYLEVEDPEGGPNFRVYAVSTDTFANNGPSNTQQIGFASDQPLKPGLVYTVVGSGSTHTNAGGSTNEPAFTDLTEFCFASGTRIQTNNGWQNVEDLTVGTLVWTRDNGPKPLRWVGVSNPKSNKTELVVLSTGAVGNQKPLRVSQNHRMVVSGWKAQLLTGEDEILVAAKFLVNGRNIRLEPAQNTQLVHFMFDQHEIVNADGAMAESFFLGDYSAAAMTDETRAEILELFPELQNKFPAHTGTAIPVSKAFEGTLVAQF